ncbi:MAG: DUF1330 domain-containing protein [Sphingomonadaceae bacterium]
MPAYLVVTATVSEPAAMAAYQQRLDALGLYAAHGGRTLLRGRAAVPLEDWDGRAVVVSEFPDRAAAQAFWDDPRYQQEVKPLRAGAGAFHVAIFDGLIASGAAA